MGGMGELRSGLSRRDFLRAAGITGALGVSGSLLGARVAQAHGRSHGGGQDAGGGGQTGMQQMPDSPVASDAMQELHMGNGARGDVDLSRFDPTEFLRTFDYGEERREGGRTVREYELTAQDAEIEVAPNVMYPAWTYNGQVPGPTLRATEGDRMRLVFKNRASHPHTVHFHGIHPADMDGMFEIVAPGREYVYKFDAEPFGSHIYHCHVLPLKEHIARGMYGAFIVDPKEGRPEADEMVMVQNGFDTNFDQSNELYAANTVAFHYARYPIKIKKNELIRIYISNLLEFDFVNSIHIHANFFDYYPTGTKLEPSEFTDTKIFAQGERGIMEFRYKYPGMFMFHTHISEFTELGWSGFFEVVE